MSGTGMTAAAERAEGAGLASGAVVGYAQLGGAGADAERERRLAEAGCGRVFRDLAGGQGSRGAREGGDAGRAELRECLGTLRAGDVLVVTSLDQLAGSQRGLLAVMNELRRRGAGLRSLREGLDTTAPGGEAIFRVFDGLADFGRAAISAGTSEGLAAARANGKRLGRPPALTAEQLRDVRELLSRPESTVSGVARQLGVSRSTLYKYLPDTRRTVRPGPAVDRPAERADAPASGPVADGLPRADGAHRAAAEPGAHLARYEARPGRRALVIDDLGDLRGPVTGHVELPLRLFWSLPGHRFDLRDPDMRLWYYQTVLREASRPDDLAGYLNAGTLARLWPELYLPAGVRRAWEERHPSLRAGAAV